MKLWVNSGFQLEVSFSLNYTNFFIYKFLTW